LVSLFPHPSQEDLVAFYRDYGEKKDRGQVELTRASSIYHGRLQKIQQYANGKRLLDIGAGLGTFLALAKDAGFEVTGVELSPDQCKKAKEQYGLDLLCRDICDVKEEIGNYDVIHMHHVLEHLTSPGKVLSLAHDLLNDNGVLVIEVPYQLTKVQSLFRSIENGRTNTFPLDHLYFFSPKTLRDYARANGFSAIAFNQFRAAHRSARRYGFFGNHMRFLFHRVASWLWIPTSGFLEFYCWKVGLRRH
jgi:SAM-dependent methyltransferase